MAAAVGIKGIGGGAGHNLAMKISRIAENGGGVGPSLNFPRWRLPHLCRFCKGGHHRPRRLVHASHTNTWISCYLFRMRNRLPRHYGAGYLQFITTSCYQRRPLLGSRQNRDLFLEVMEQVRHRHHFVVVGHVVRVSQPRSWGRKGRTVPLRFYFVNLGALGGWRFCSKRCGLKLPLIFPNRLLTISPLWRCRVGNFRVII